MNKARTFVVCAGLLALLLPRPAVAVWPTDPGVNVPLCSAGGAQFRPVSVSDGEGGAIVIWEDNRSGNQDLYAQRISADGAVLWTLDGVALCTATGDQWYPKIVSDSAGGAIVTWEDYRTDGLITRISTLSGYRQMGRSSGRPTAWPSLPPPWA
jgi:hypothetical protein